MCTWDCTRLEDLKLHKKLMLCSVKSNLLVYSEALRRKRLVNSVANLIDLLKQLKFFYSLNLNLWKTNLSFSLAVGRLAFANFVLCWIIIAACIFKVYLLLMKLIAVVLGYLSTHQTLLLICQLLSFAKGSKSSFHSS